MIIIYRRVIHTPNLEEMKIMKQKMIPLILLAIFILPLQTLPAENIKIGYFNLQPHTYQGKDGQVAGAAVVYFNMLAEKTGDTIEWVGPMPLPRLTEALKQGEIDATLGFPNLPAFQSILYFPNNYIYVKATN
jgi:ABC-type amino acid transport substrate-binding protein